MHECRSGVHAAEPETTQEHHRRQLVGEEGLFGVRSISDGVNTPMRVYQNFEWGPAHLVRCWGYARKPYAATDDVTAILPRSRGLHG
ncbi:hypothetical protein ACFQRB_19700 [Halobaculum litoreum]|uniref:Uncharacterized protein n=1 Tax=Halobaculum litoreum TaxID=3031998 RepID=A0ABD5XY16_9EURY